MIDILFLPLTTREREYKQIIKRERAFDALGLNNTPQYLVKDKHNSVVRYFNNKNSVLDDADSSIYICSKTRQEEG